MDLQGPGLVTAPERNSGQGERWATEGTAHGATRPSHAWSPRSWLYSLLILLALSCYSSSRAEPVTASHSYPGDDIFEQLAGGSGLSSQVISRFAEDGDGFLWIASQDGLQRWDGYRLWTYKTQIGRDDSLPDNLTQVLHTDPSGRVWVGTSSGGLARFDRDGNKFVRYHNSLNGPSPVNVQSITDDGRGGLWIGGGSGLDHLDVVTGNFTHDNPTDQEGLSVNMGSVLALQRSTDGALWIGTSHGLLRSAAGGSQGQAVRRVLMPVGGPDSISIQAIFADPAGTIWAGTDHGVYLVERASYNADASLMMARRLPSSGAIPQSLFSSSITSIAADPSGGVWIGTQDQGIFVVTPGRWAVRHIAHDATQPTSLAGDFVVDLFLSRQGVMWVGSRHGVSYLDTTPRGIFTLLGGESSSASLRDSDVYSVLPRHDGTVWLGLSKHGIDILGPSGRRVAEVQTSTVGTDQETANSLPAGTVGAMCEAAAGKIYIVTQHGLYRAEHTEMLLGKDGKVLSFNPRLSRLSIGDDAEEGLTEVLCDHDDQGREFLWLGGTNGLWTYDPASPGPAVRRKLKEPLTDPRIRILRRGENNSLWIATLNGLNRLDIATGKVQTIPADPADVNGLGAGMISSLLIDHRGRLWVGTFTGGINLLQNIDAHGRAKFRRIVEGLPNDNVDNLLEAADGKIWASTDGGLAVIDPFNFSIRTLGKAEGAYLDTYWDGVGAKAPNGDLLFGGSGGLTIVRPSLVKPWTYAPPVVITSARIGLTDVPISRFNNGPDEYPIWISADQNNLTVEFAALDYTAPLRNRYEYRLAGFDRDWIPTDPSRRVLRYTNLPPGRYTLLLRGSNRDGVWAPVRSVKILVLPTWYQKAWFRFVALFATLLALFGIFLLATAYMRRQQRELERQVALRTAELEQKTVELKTSQQKLEHMAYTDSLTGLPNRRMFTEHFRRLLALKRRQQSTFALLLMDFDSFKSINDTYGHDAGDAVLREMADRMSAVVRESDCLARLGGDEYGLILGQSPDADATEMVCQKILDSFVEPVMFRDIELRTSPSIGVAFYPYDGKTQDTLYKTADLALYDAKRSGGNSCSWSPGAAPHAHLHSFPP